MRLILLLVIVVICPLLGCEKSKNTVPQKDGPNVAKINDPYDRSVPKLAVNSLVWGDNLEPLEISKKRKEAKEIAQAADRFKSNRNYAKAESYYQKASSADPSWGYPAYQLACNYSLWGRHKLALESFKTSLEKGFDQYPTVIADDELGQVRDNPDFHHHLAQVKTRYMKNAKEKIGTPFAVRPKTKKPAGGFPIMLLLHGYGDTNRAYLDNGQKWAELGFVAIAVPGSYPMAQDQFQWSPYSFDETKSDLDAILDSELLDGGLVDRKRVFLLGFSQGALHAMTVASRYPDTFQGVITLSPGGAMAETLARPQIKSGNSKMIFIHGRQEPHDPIARAWRKACEKAGWRFTQSIHRGGHHFPQNWDKSRARYAATLLKQ